MNPYVAGARQFRFGIFARRIVAVAIFLHCTVFANTQQPASPLELSRTVRNWEFLPVLGSRAGLFGNEAGRFAAWVYPLKLFRNFHLTFHVGDRALPAERLARTLLVRPDPASILHTVTPFPAHSTH